VNTNTPEAAMPFNLPLIPSGASSQTYNLGGGANVSYGLSMQNYLVDADGYLNYPVIGRIKAAGMTKQELVSKIKSEIYPRYIKEEPIILLRYANFRVSVLGEVARAGTFTIDNEKISILEALALAGDMTIYGNRSQVLLIRELGAGRETIRIDIRDKYLTSSPYFFLQQGDVLYVEPNGPKARSSAIGSAETMSISIVGTLISLTTLLVSLLN
jgi:polysaccharide export outer membrane protein